MDCFRAVCLKGKESLIQIFVRADGEDPHRATGWGWGVVIGICVVRPKSVLIACFSLI